GEAHIGDVVERAQRLHHHLADGLGGDLALALAFELAHDLRHGLIDALGLDRALAQRDLHRAQELVAVEGNAPAVALDHRELTQLHPLEGREAEIAGKANAATADDGRVFRRTRVLHLRIEAGAVRTAHLRPLEPYEFGLHVRGALSLRLRMIFSENRFPLFRIMRYPW